VADSCAVCVALTAFICTVHCSVLLHYIHVLQLYSNSLNYSAKHFQTYVVEHPHPPRPQSFDAIAGSSSSSSSSANNNSSLLLAIIRRVTSTGTDSSVQLVAAEVLTLCLDPKNMKNSSDSHRFMQCFYKHYVPWLLLPLRSTSVGGTGSAEKSAELSAERASCKLLVCELLAHLVTQHGLSMCCFLVCNVYISASVLQLLQEREVQLKVSSYRCTTSACNTVSLIVVIGFSLR
jgi:hypothetical protein